MIHHVSLGTNQIDRAKTFYVPLMKLVGLHVIDDGPHSIDFGVGEISFSLETPSDGRPATAGNGVHVAFVAATRDVVDLFYSMALASGGRDAGRPGPRPEYDPNYYGAFVYDLDGNKIEAVTYSGKPRGS